MEDFNMQMSPLFPGFTPKADVKGYPVMGWILDANRSFYIPRAGTPEEREQVLEQIIARQVDIEDNGVNWPSTLFYAEGTTTNGT
jgi:hypothetical protein